MSDKGIISKIYKELTQFNSKETNNPTLKMGKGPKQTFLKGRHKIDQQVHEKVLNITNHQGNENQRHNEISPYTSYNGYYQKEKINVGEDVVER